MDPVDLNTLDCIPCLGDVPPLGADEIGPLLTQLHGWDLVDGHHIRKWYPFDSFAQGLGFVIQIAVLAEREGHHPNVHLSYQGVGIDIWTYKDDAVTLRDLALASLIDRIPRREAEAKGPGQN